MQPAHNSSLTPSKIPVRTSPRNQTTHSSQVASTSTATPAPAKHYVSTAPSNKPPAKPLTTYTVTAPPDQTVFSKDDIPWNQMQERSGSHSAIEKSFGLLRSREKMDHGGQSASVECWFDPVNDRQFVIKFIGEAQTKNPSYRRFLDSDGKGEAIGLKTGDHPHIVKTHGLLLKGQDKTDKGKHPFVIIHSADMWKAIAPDMLISAVICDRAEGKDLFELLDNRSFYHRNIGNPRFIIPVILGITRALIHLHERGIIYRDLKLENIIVDPKTNHATLVDFGLARELGALQRTSSFCGTTLLLAPEAYSGREYCHDRNGYGQESETWSLGHIMYYLLTGRYITDAAEAKARKNKLSNQDTEKEIYRAIHKFSDLSISQKLSNLSGASYATSGQRNIDAQQWLQVLAAGLMDINPEDRTNLYALRNDLKRLGQSLSIPDPHSYLDTSGKPPPKPPRTRSTAQKGTVV